MSWEVFLITVRLKKGFVIPTGYSEAQFSQKKKKKNANAEHERNPNAVKNVF